MTEGLNMTTISRSLWFICIVVLLGLDILGTEAVGKPLQALEFGLVLPDCSMGAAPCSCGRGSLWRRMPATSAPGDPESPEGLASLAS
jgi:hypothetical protein